MRGDRYHHRDAGLAALVRMVRMKAAGKSSSTPRNKIVSLAVILLAAALAIYAAYEADTRPTSSDSSIDADVVHVAAAVGGRVIGIAVAENTRVAKDDLLFQIDPVPYRLAVAQAD